MQENTDREHNQCYCYARASYGTHWSICLRTMKLLYSTATMIDACIVNNFVIQFCILQSTRDRRKGGIRIHVLVYIAHSILKIITCSKKGVNQESIHGST